MRKFTEEHIQKLRESHLGKPGFWTGKKFSEEHRLLLSQSHKGRHLSSETEFKKGMTPFNKGLSGYHLGDKNGMWKGDKVGYYALHAWVRRKLGSPVQCKYCGSEKNIQWANIDHKYTRNLEDWIQLCVPCHRKHDNA